MTRNPREDGPGVWHHVMNRGIARRTVFEERRDVRYFLSCLARAVRAGWIEVHAYCVMTTHFHLLVRSPDASLSQAMERILNDYVRWFNRGRKRDGSLFRGRFRSRRADWAGYRRRLVCYIDNNPVLARLVAQPDIYPHGSARHYAHRSGPIWLERSWVESQVCSETGQNEYDPLEYPACLGGACSPELARVIERRIEIRAPSHDPLDELLGAAPERVLAWMRRKAELADGTRIDLPVLDAELVTRVVTEEHASRPELPVNFSRKHSCGWRLLETALLRDMCGCSWADIGARIGVAEQAAMRAYRLHAQALSELPEYAAILSRVVCRANELCYGASLNAFGFDRTRAVALGGSSSPRPQLEIPSEKCG